MQANNMARRNETQHDGDGGEEHDHDDGGDDGVRDEHGSVQPRRAVQVVGAHGDFDSFGGPVGVCRCVCGFVGGGGAGMVEGGEDEVEGEMGCHCERWRRRGAHWVVGN
jgi:hypothetical protein